LQTTALLLGVAVALVVAVVQTLVIGTVVAEVAEVPLMALAVLLGLQAVRVQAHQAREPQVL
jgi:hypothetical protein